VAVITATETLPVMELRWVGCPAPPRRISPQMLVGTGLLRPGLGHSAGKPTRLEWLRIGGEGGPARE